jgi:hypothetical protein
MHKLISLVGGLCEILVPCSFKPIFIIKMKPVHSLPDLNGCKSIYFGIGETLEQLLKVALIEIIEEVNVHNFRV